MDDGEGEYRVSDYLPDAWTPEAVANLASWRQGDLVHGQNLAWLSTTVDDVTGQCATEHLGTVELGPNEAGLLIVTSQTCDIVGTGTGASHPFVQVSPILDLSSESADKKNNIQRFMTGYLVEATSLRSNGKFFAVDLRISMPLSKTVLTSQQGGNSAFESETDRINFAESIAIKFRRPALHDAVSEHFTKALTQYISAKKKEAKKAPAKRAAAGASGETSPPSPKGGSPSITEAIRATVGRLLQPTPRSPAPHGKPSRWGPTRLATHARRWVKDVGDRVPTALPTTTSDTSEAWWREVEHVRLVVHGDRLMPSSVQLIVLTTRRFDEVEKRLWWDFAGQGKAALKPHNIRYEETVIFATLDDLSARLYKGSIPLRITELGRPPTF